MSAGYGIFKIRFTKEDKKADSELAKKIYEHCLTMYDFFTEDTIQGFEIDEAKGEICTAGDGVDIKRAFPEAAEGYWLFEVYEEFKPAQMKATIIQDFSESGFSENWYTKFFVEGRNEDKTLFKDGPSQILDCWLYDQPEYYINMEDGSLLNRQCESCSIFAKHKETGRLIRICDCYIDDCCIEDEDEDEDDVPVYNDLYDNEGNKVKVGQEDNIATVDS